ncbi:hypothetical protein BHM03_00050989 [Ensete ventricosum]|nr:hypothetical protein BHM03_00050989 [Ensete ventricosum]
MIPLPLLLLPPPPFFPSTVVSIAACMTLPTSTAAISRYHLSSALLPPPLSAFPSPIAAISYTFTGDTVATLHFYAMLLPSSLERS